MKIAFIGLGAIGLPIARRLALHPDLELSLYDTRLEVLEAEAELGRVASSVADAVVDADVVITVLPADAHVRSVAREVAVAARPEQTFLDFSTIAPGTMLDVAELLQAAGVRSLGGSLTRSVAAAETGTLSVFVGGPIDLIEPLRPALDQIASDVRIVDTVAAAKALKIVNNMIVSSLGLVLCETILVGARHGVDPHELVVAVAAGGGDSWPLHNHIVKHLLADDLGPGRFSVRYMGKDAALASQLAGTHGQPAWFAGLVEAAYRGAESLGLGEHYHPIVMRWLEHAASVPPVTGQQATLGESEGPVTPVVDALCRGAVALQALITLDALRLVACEGVPVDAALEHFESGSASNDCVRALLAAEPDRSAAMTMADLVADLTATCGLAAQAAVPGTAFEVGRNIALALVAEHGEDLTATEVIERVPVALRRIPQYTNLEGRLS